MRHSILSLLLLVACVVSTSWAACNDGNTNFGDGCYNNVVESGYSCPSSGTCSLSDNGNTRTNTAQNLVFQTNFNNGIFDISSTHMAFKANTGVTCSRDNTDATHQSYCTFTGSGVGITGATTPAAFPTGANPRTVCAWIRINDATAGSQIFFAYGTATASNGFAVGRSQNKIFLSGYTISATNSATIPQGAWTHVCAAYGGSTSVSFWQNGVAGTPSPAALSQALNTQVSQSSDMFVGRNIGSSNLYDFVGDLFDLRLYDTLLDTTAVGVIYNEGLANKALVTLTDCGNGLLEAGEVCDDGNTVSGDGCSSTCAIEATYVCTGAPSQCATPSLAKEYAVASSGDASIVTSGNSQVSTAASAVDDSRLTWKPNVQSYRVGEFTYIVPGLYPYATYTVDFIFAETVKTAAKQRVFDVEVQGSTPQWSPIDVFASAGKSNTAIMKSITTAADNLGNLAIEFSNNGIVQAIRVTRRVHAVASLAAGGLTVSGSTTSSLFNPLKGYPDFSMEVYINTAAIATSSIISKGNSFSLQLTSTGTFVCVAGGSTVNGAITISASSWYHIACVVDSKAGKASLYINGVLDVSENVVPTWPASSTALVFGSNFVGYLDSPRLWQRALTHNELLAHAVSSASVPLSYGLIEEWSFDSLTTFSAGAIGTNGGAGNAAKFLTVDENTFETAEASPVVQISCGGSGSGLVIADSYFVGGAPVSTSDNLVAPAGSGVPDSLLQTARTGDFEYVVSGFPPRQSYTVGVVLVSYEGTASMNGYIQGVQVLSAESVSEGSPEYDEFTVLADYAGVISIKFTSATVSAIVFTPVLAPAGSLAFFVGNAAPGLSYQSFTASATSISYTNLAGSNSDLTAPSTDLPYATALSTTANTGFAQTISGLIPNAYYRVRFHLAELDSTKTSGSRTVNVYAQNALISGPIDIYGTTGGTATPYTTFGIAKANNAGSIVAEVKGCSGGCILSAVEVQPGPVIYKAAATLPQNAQQITIYGADLLPFNGNMGIELVQGTETPVNCDNLFVLPDRLVCVFSTALVTGTLNAKLYILNPTVVEVKNVVIGTVIDALSVEASTAVLATNTARLVLDGAGFGDDSTVTLNGNIACAVISVSEDVIICKPAATLPLGVVRATVTSYGQTSTSVQVGTAVSPPQVASVPSVYASSSTMVINGKGFIASPNHNQNSVTLKQNTNSRKRTLSSSAPSCTIISATTTSITCALSNVVAGPLSVIVIVAGGSSSTFTVNVLPTQTSSCSPRGAKDAYDNTLCNCWSGYAPSDSLYSDCNVAPLCMQEEVTATSTGSAMSAPVTAFVQDKLTVYQSSPIVKHRRETTIRFSYPTGLTSWAPASAVPGAVGAQTCGYPGNLWQKSIDAAECRDVYKAQIPWTGHTACGFVEDKSVNNDTYSFYKAQMDTTYVTAYPTGSGYMHRITTDSYLVTVSFRKALTFGVSFMTEFVESSTEGFVSVNVDSSDYDPNSRTMYVTITAETRWPYLLNLSQINAGTFSSDIGSPASSIIASFTGSELNEQSADAYYACSTDAESTCVQLFLATFKITNTTLCDIAGTYSFSGVQLLCRDVALGQACPTHPVTKVQFKVGSTNLCEDAAIDPSSSLIPDLKAYHEPSMSNAPQIEFYDNDFAYMQFGLESDYASIDAVYFSYIAVSLNPDNGNRDVIYDINQDPAVRLDVGLQRQEINSLVLAGNAINANFSFQLSVTKLVNTVAQLAISSPGVPSQLLITASVDVIFHGNNRKRTIDFGGVASASKSAAHPITFHHVERSSVAKHNVEKSETTEEVPSVGETNIWADLDSPDAQTDLDSWFSGLESSGDKLSMTSFLVAACFLLLVIIA